MPTCEYCYKYPPGQCPCPCHREEKQVGIALAILVEDVYMTQVFFEFYARFYPEKLRVARLN